MKSIKIIIMSALILYGNTMICQAREVTSAVTYEFSGGRFGDNMRAYCQGKWIAYKTGMHLLYKPFHHSNELVLDAEERKLSAYYPRSFRSVVRLSAADALNPDYKFDLYGNILYIAPWSPYIVYSVYPDVRDIEFKRLMQKLAQPLHQPAPLYLPQNKVTVAIHWRSCGNGGDGPCLSGTQTSVNYYTQKPKTRYNGWYDKDIYMQKYPYVVPAMIPGQAPNGLPHMDVPFPDKFPPYEYYVEQLEKIYEIIGKKPLYVCVFTDHPHPARITDQLRKDLAQCDIEYVCMHESDNHCEKNIIEDIYYMTQFDCLIRSSSNYSTLAHRIGDFAVVAYSQCPRWTVITDKNNPTIKRWQLLYDDTQVVIDQDLVDRLIKQKYYGK